MRLVLLLLLHVLQLLLLLVLLLLLLLPSSGRRELRCCRRGMLLILLRVLALLHRAPKLLRRCSLEAQQLRRGRRSALRLLVLSPHGGRRRRLHLGLRLRVCLRCRRHVDALQWPWRQATQLRRRRNNGLRMRGPRCPAKARRAIQVE